MTWDLEAAKKRCAEAKRFWNGNGKMDCTALYVAINADLPAAIARIEWQAKMLEDAGALLQRHVRGRYDADYTRWLRDLEGGPPDDLA